MSEVAEGPETRVSGRRSRASALRVSIASGRSSTICSSRDDADVEVGDEGERTPPLARAGGEDDRAGLGDREGAAGEDAVEGCRARPRSEPVVDDELEPGRPPRRRQTGRDPDPAGCRARARASPIAAASSAALDPSDLGPVVGEPLAEELGARRSVERPCRGGRTPAPGSAREAPAVAPRTRARTASRAALTGATATTRGSSRRQAAAGRGCASSRRAAPAAGRSSPSRTNGRWTTRPSRWASSKRRRPPKTQPSRPIATRSATVAARRDGLAAQMQQHRRDVDLDRADLVAGAAEARGERQRGAPARSRRSCGVRIAPIGPG